MSIRSVRYASLALALAAAPAVSMAAMGFGNTAPVIDALSVSPVPVPAGSTATISCAAHDGGTVTKLVVTVSGGTLPAGGVSQELAITPGASVAATVAWALPGIPGSFTVTCAATDNGGSFGAAPITTTSAPLTVASVAAPEPPVIDAVAGPAAPVLAGATGEFSVTAHDPAGGELTYAWTASGGTLASGGATASWTAPGIAGSYTITVTVTGPSGQAVQATVAATAILAPPRGGFAANVVSPRRFAVDSRGNVYAVDAEMGVLLLTPRGELRGVLDVGEVAAGVAVAPSGILVSTASGRVLEVSPATGRVTREIALADGPLRGSTALQYEPSRGLVWATERAANRVRAFRLDGRTAFVVAAAGAAPLAGPVDVALDAAGGRVWVALEIARRDVFAGDPPEIGLLVHGYGLDGGYLGSRVKVGSAAGQVSRAGGIAVGSTGELYVSDVFQGQVEAFGPDGASHGAVGTFGAGATQLRTPLGVAVLGNGDLLVANLGAGRLERFGVGAPPPPCEGDQDCDGLPDAWETTVGLSPVFAGDALLDLDGDGLNAAEELSSGTDPRSDDTDADGTSDRDEVLAGTDPLTPTDHRAELLVSAPADSGPGLVELAASAVGPEACVVEWTQQGGPAVTLRGAPGLAPSYVARLPGTYRFDAIARCGAVSSEVASAVTVVRNEPPVVEAGGIRVVRPISSLDLDGSATDANGDALALAWDQILGPALAARVVGDSVSIRPRDTGYHVFQLTATDAAGGEGTAEVPVLVVPAVAPTAFASSPLRAAAGDEVVLDASASQATTASPAFAWQQVSGPAVSLAGAGEPVARFIPVGAGRYAFEVTIREGELRSPPARVDVFVGDGFGRLPAAVTAPVLFARPGAVVRLDGTRSTPAVEGAELAYAWRRVAGPAAGLTSEAAAVAAVVPFDPGTYVFELTVREGDMESLPARVRVEVSSPGEVLPVAVAEAPGLATVGDVVRLDGRKSTGAERFRWTQVGGPWVPLERADGDVARFRPPVPGLYAFELVVVDGALRSAPQVVSVLVFGAEAAR